MLSEPLDLLYFGDSFFPLLYDSRVIESKQELICLKVLPSPSTISLVTNEDHSLPCWTLTIL